MADFGNKKPARKRAKNNKTDFCLNFLIISLVQDFLFFHRLLKRETP